MWEGKVYCQVCGQRCNKSELRRRWDDKLVCPKDWETRHPQEFVRAVPDPQNPGIVSPPPAEVFVNYDGICTVEKKQAIAGIGVAGCMIAGWDVHLADEEPVPAGTFTNSL